MKRIVSAVLCLLLLFSASSALAATVTATGDVYVRSGPGLDYDSLTALDEGEIATYLGQVSVDSRGVAWYKVFYDEVTGWVSSRYSELDTWSWSYGEVVATGNVWVRSGPGLTYDELGAIEIDDVLEYRNEISEDSRGMMWYKVYYGDHPSAWISARYAELTTYHTSKFVTATGDANIRSGAGASYDVLATMWKNDTAIYLGVTSKDVRGTTWYKVNYGGVTGWVTSKLTKLDSAKETPAWGSFNPFANYGSVTVTGDANLRSGPGLTYDKVVSVAEGSTAKYLGESSADSRGITWYKVEFDGKTGWISSRYATKD